MGAATGHFNQVINRSMDRYSYFWPTRVFVMCCGKTRQWCKLLHHRNPMVICTNLLHRRVSPYHWLLFVVVDSNGAGAFLASIEFLWYLGSKCTSAATGHINPILDTTTSLFVLVLWTVTHTLVDSWCVVERLGSDANCCTIEILWYYWTTCDIAASHHIIWAPQLAISNARKHRIVNRTPSTTTSLFAHTST
jgi:hypothetical protein